MEDTIRILITTDNHVGYNEHDPITGDDAWRTFHEIMMLAKDREVDMVLQSGDLFHVNKPSKKSLYEVLKTLRLSCLGNKPCELELLSDPAPALPCGPFSGVNYEDPNINVAIPIFAISGNHDDATGDAFLTPMDLLHATGLVNHFGKVLESDKINLTPLLFQKGNTKLALYGMASVRDERLFRTFKDGGVAFQVPEKSSGDEWFNIFCVHQNHTGHTNTAFLPEQFLPDFLNLIIWGHEHECIPHMAHNPIKGFDVLQPGSSVATSLCEAEAKPKHVFVLEIQKGEKPKLEAVPLQTVRTFQLDTLSLSDVAGLRPHDKESISKYLVEKVEQMIEDANNETRTKLRNQFSIDDSDHGLIALPLPLVRLRVDYSSPTGRDSIIDYQVENPRRFSNRFVGRVANSNNVVQFFKKKRHHTKTARNKDGYNNDADIEKLMNENNGELEIETLVKELANKMQLSLLPEIGMNEAVRKFVDKDEKNALKQFIDNEINQEVKILAVDKNFQDVEDPEELKILMKEVKRSNSKNYANTASSMEKEKHIKQDVGDQELGEQDFHASSSSRTTRTKKVPESPDSSQSLIVSSDNDEEDDVMITVSSDDDGMAKSAWLPAEKYSIKRKSTSSRKAPKKVNSKTNSKTKSSKTDILGSLLARKRK